jgi:hypothetical protein
MFMGEELMRGIEQYGRWNMQEFVARSQEVIDVLSYLRAERMLEMFKVMSFITADSYHFSKKTDSPPSPDAFGGTSQCKMEEI